MSFGWSAPDWKPGMPIPSAWLKRMGDSIAGLMRLTVGRGLSIRWVKDIPTISLDGDFGIYDAITTSSFPARDDEQMGPGKFKFRDATLEGELSDREIGEFDAFNYTSGSIPTDNRCLVARVNGTWRIVSADCSAG
jgi:hypothetical protein